MLIFEVPLDRPADVDDCEVEAYSHFGAVFEAVCG